MTEQRRKITRNRETLACSECSRRKLKCNHARPCDRCIKGGTEAACRYQKSANGRRADHERRTQAEARLEHLEQLVHELSQANGKVNETSDDAPQPAYAGSTHWSAMLKGIDDLRDALHEHQPLEPRGEPSSTDIVFGLVPKMPYEQVLSQFLPTKQEANAFTAAYFRNRAMVAPFIHSGQFMRRYQRFWDNPSRAPPLFTSMLFSICHIAADVMAQGDHDKNAAYRFAIASAHCLIAGRYSKPQKLTIESLLLYLQAQCITSLEISEDVGTLFGTLIRLATRMGYHRDPDNFSYTPFENEMRRRTWSLAMQLDLLISFQQGLPSNVQYPTWDSCTPSNLLDTDFDEDTQVLPPPRPDAEVTDISFYNAKFSLMTVFEKILRHALDPADDKISELTSLNDELDKTYYALPPTLHPRPMSESIIDPPSLIVCRLCVYFIYAKSRCVLHRPYATKGHTESIQICHEASSGLVRYFLNASTEFQPGGHASSERWFLGSISWNDFLLGSMVLCLVVCVSRQNITSWPADLQETIALLDKAHSACQSQQTRGKETARVTKVLEAVLTRTRSPRPLDSADAPTLPMLTDYIPTDVKDNGNVPDDSSLITPPDSQSLPPLYDYGLFGPGYDDQLHSIEDISWKYIEDFLQLPVDGSVDL